MAQVLLIDDDANVRYALSMAIRRAGHDVVEAQDGQEGYNYLKEQKHTVDVVVTDIIMDNMDGIEFINKLREHNKILPIIAISGGGRYGNKEYYLDLSKHFTVNDTFEKPLKEWKLIERIEELSTTQ